MEMIPALGLAFAVMVVWGVAAVASYRALRPALLRVLGPQAETSWTTAVAVLGTVGTYLWWLG